MICNLYEMFYFFFGQDSFSSARRLRSLREEFGKKNPGSTIETLDPNQSDSDTLFAENLTRATESQGLFSTAKLVIIRNLLSAGAKKFPKSMERLEKVLQNPFDGMFIIYETENFDRRQRLFKQLQKNRGVKSEEFTAPTGAGLNSWIKDHLKEAGFAIERDALELLISYLADDEGQADLWQVDGELQKLMLLREEKKEILRADIEAVVTPNVTRNVFALTDLFAKGSAGEAMRMLEQMVSPGNPADNKGDAIQIVGALASQLRSMLLIKSFGRASDNEVAGALGWKPGRVWINRKLADRFSAQKLKVLLSDLRAIDSRLKSSEESPKLLLSLFFQKSAAL